MLLCDVMLQRDAMLLGNAMLHDVMLLCDVLLCDVVMLRYHEMRSHVVM